MSRFKWPQGPVHLLVISILIGIIPHKWEGPMIVEDETGFGLSYLNTFGLIPLLAAVYWIQKGLWKRRIYLFNKVTIFPGAASLIIFFMGLGLGLFAASAFRDFSYWWAVGGIIFIAFLINVILISGKMQD